MEEKSKGSSHWKGQSRVLKVCHWHSSHLPPLRHAAICALDLGHKPTALDDNLLFIDIKLKFSHDDLPPNRRYEPVGGFTMTVAEVRDVFGNMGVGTILDSFKDANDHMRKKGGLGVVAVMLRAHNIVDIVKIILPSPASTKAVQEADDWGKDWLEKLRLAVELD
ncbi:hypothetical protein NLJ89_g652 [Agrocybe chaxingu]|uniref:Uncharacterized protein n=1 Tax=Agrocybe chaxingu TaxID=84603 RepID=A0A9W8N1H8_9AGAR|nr:hypothetical protein NLJ89_g652 [Agrocybe chaxingu]